MSLAEKTAVLRQKLADRCTRLLPFAPGVRRELPPHLAKIHSATNALDATMAEVEARFLEVSTTVEKTTDTGREIVTLGEALISLALGQGGGEIIIDTTAEHIWKSIEFVEHSIEESDQLIQQLKTINGQISESLSAEQALARTLAPLTYVQTLFRVESSGLPLEVQTMFQALVNEIERVRLNVEREFRDKFQLIRDIQAILNRAIAQLNTRATAARLSVVDLRRHLTQSLAQMKESYEKNRDRDTRLAEVTKVVTKETGQIIMSLQFYDTFTQKLQHTRKILAEIEAALVEVPDKRAAACRTLRFVEQSGRICGAQLGAMSTELTQAGISVIAGMQVIAKQMTALDDDCVALRDMDSSTTGVDGAVQILLDSLADVQRLVGDAERFAMESHETILPIGGKTTNFTKFINNLSFEIQLIGLNAEVQSAHVGQGTGLDVLSAQTSAISRETSQLSTKLAADLDTLTAGLSQMVHSFQAIRERSKDFSRSLTTESAADASSLHHYRDGALNVLQQIGDLLPKLQEQIQSATEQSDFVELATKPIQELQRATDGLTAVAASAADRSGAQVETTGLTDHFLKFYTMASEGDVHRRALGQAVTAGLASAAAAPAAATGEVDLFGFDEPAPAAPAAAPAPDTGGIELFGFDDPAPAAAPAAAPAPPAAPPPAPAAPVDVDLWLDDPPTAPAPAPDKPTNTSERTAA